MSPIDRLLAAEPFDEAPEFEPAVAECRDVLRRRFPRYAEFLDRRPGEFPALFLPVLKSTPFAMPADVEISVKLTSSGTTGQPSETPLDAENWQRRVQAMRASYQGLDLFGISMHALAFLMDPATTRMAGSLVIDAVLRKMPNVVSITYLAKMGSAGPEFKGAEALASLKYAAAQGPVVLIGYPALMSAIMAGLMQAGQTRLPLPSGSCILTGGGWKSFLPGLPLDQAEFRTKASAFFAVPPTSIRDMFGLSECPAVFVQCREGRYHVPAWARAHAIDPETGRDVPAGDTGILQLTVPLTTCYPLLKILTTDKASVEMGCGCGLRAPYLTPRGRLTAARFETCAMKIGAAVGGQP